VSHRREGVCVEVRWAINPFRGDKFEELWTPAAEAALDFGATYWALLRSQEGQLDFTQHAHFPTKDHWDRYWYSEEISAARVAAAGYYQVPLLPTFHTIVGTGTLEPVAAPATS
jgi:hypothetical protein